MKKSLSRSRIQGISYRRSSGGSPQPTQKKERKLPPSTNASSTGNGAPQPLSRADIHRLMQDLGRQMLHTLVSESVEMIPHWRQASHALDRNFEDAFFDDPRARKIGGMEEAQEQAETLLQARRNFRLWKHRVSILEMIAQAQQSL